MVMEIRHQRSGWVTVHFLFEQIMKHIERYRSVMILTPHDLVMFGGHVQIQWKIAAFCA